MSPGRITDHEDVVQIESILIRMREHETYRKVGVLHAGREDVIGSKPIREVHHGKTALGKGHAVKLIDILVPVDPSASVDIDDHRKILPGIPGSVDIQDMPFEIRPIDNVVIPDDVLRRSLPLVFLVIGQ